MCCCSSFGWDISKSLPSKLWYWPWAPKQWWRYCSSLVVLWWLLQSACPFMSTTSQRSNPSKLLRLGGDGWLQKMDIQSLQDICGCFLDHLWLEFSCSLVGKRLFDRSSLGSKCFPKEQWVFWIMGTHVNFFEGLIKRSSFLIIMILTRNLPIYWLFMS